MSVAGKNDNNMFLPTAELYQEECKKADTSRLRLNFLSLHFFDIMYWCQGVSGTYVQYKDDEFRRRAEKKKRKTTMTLAYGDAGYLRKDKKNGKCAVRRRISGSTDQRLPIQRVQRTGQEMNKKIACNAKSNCSSNVVSVVAKTVRRMVGHT